MNDSVLTIRNFTKFQHFKKPKPPWTKFYRDTPMSYPFCMLPDIPKLFFPWLVLVASEHDNRIPYDIQFLCKRLGFTEDTITDALEGLLDVGMVSVSKKPGRKAKAIKRVASGDTKDLPETETETYTKEKRESQSDDELSL